MNPEQKLAKKLLIRHNIQLPYDLEQLVEKYADIRFVKFPVDADGMSCGLKKQKRPLILINNSRPKTRQRFTLAHELGHVIIPWHIGNIISHTEQNLENDLEVSLSLSEYRQIEKEANKFAAELLFPTSWLKSKIEDINFDNFQNILKNIIQETKASRDACLINIFNLLPSGFSCVEIDNYGYVIRSFTSPDTPVYKVNWRHNCYDNEPYTIYEQRKSFSLGDKDYILWTFDTSMQIPEYEDSRPWREILKVILDETLLQSKRASIDAILPAVYQSNKEKDDSVIFSSIIHGYSQKEELLPFIQHPLAKQYILKRLKELKERNNSRKYS